MNILPVRSYYAAHVKSPAAVCARNCAGTEHQPANATALQRAFAPPRLTLASPAPALRHSLVTRAQPPSLPGPFEPWPALPSPDSPWRPGKPLFGTWRQLQGLGAPIEQPADLAVVTGGRLPAAPVHILQRLLTFGAGSTKGSILVSRFLKLHVPGAGTVLWSQDGQLQPGDAQNTTRTVVYTSNSLAPDGGQTATNRFNMDAWRKALGRNASEPSSFIWAQRTDEELTIEELRPEGMLMREGVCATVYSPAPDPRRSPLD